MDSSIAPGKRIETPQGEFLVSGGCGNLPKNSHIEFDFVVAFAITQLTVSFQAIKAANTDPANTLRFE